MKPVHVAAMLADQAKMSATWAVLSSDRYHRWQCARTRDKYVRATLVIIAACSGGKTRAEARRLLEKLG